MRTKQAYFAFTASEVLKFFLPKEGEEPSAALQRLWAEACLELEDNWFLAHELYIGLQPIALESQRLSFCWERPSIRVQRHSLPAEAEALCLVMRRLPKNSFLSERMLIEPFQQEAYAFQLAKALSRFHHAPTNALGPLAGEEIFSALNLFQCRSLERLLFLEQKWLGQSKTLLLEPERAKKEHAAQLLLAEIRRLLEKFFPGKNDLFLERFMQGFVVLGHGDLRAQHIAFPAPGKTVIFGRASRDSGEQERDVLADLATLTLDLERRDLSAFARMLEEEYASRNPGALEEELYRFYLVCEGLRNVERRICAQEDSAELDPFALEVEEDLAQIRRYASGLRRPIIVAFGGVRSQAKDEVLAELLSSLPMRHLRCEGDAQEKDSLETQALLPAQLKAALKAGELVLVETELERRTQRLALGEIAKQLKTQILFVRCEFSRDEAVSWSLERNVEELPSLLHNLSHCQSQRSTFIEEGLLGRVPIELNVNLLLPAELAAEEIVEKLSRISPIPDSSLSIEN